ncbi:EAL domain-containing protein [Camelliibacillus cellulosilyticus]|uniref:EAL domain-containing protein n=1 Tax=Camelliibacillus cellulosilyticus TaxID=2174486 RepID=A0ABV9GN42_9BACL
MTTRDYQHLLNQIRETLHEVTAGYQSLFMDNPNPVITIDADGVIKAVNRAVTRQLGYAESDCIGERAMDLLQFKDRTVAILCFKKALKGTIQSFRTDLVHKNTRKIPFLMSLIPIEAQGRITGVHVVGTNQSAQLEAEQTIERLSYHDALTGLPNRALFERTLNHQIKQTKQQGKQLAVIFVDINRFKLINDTVGHAVGDQILKIVAGRLKNQLYRTHILARFEGDKFSIIIPQIMSRRSVSRFAERVCRAFDEPIVYKEFDYFLSVSLGVSMYPSDGTSQETLMKNADIALYSAKVQRDKEYLYYSKEMNEKFNERLEFESYLRKALAKEEFELYYQPQVSLDSEQVVGCEALIRWRHPKLGVVLPAQFIPQAEEIGLIEDIGLWVLRRACRQIIEWQNKGIEPFPVSVNVSVRQFLNRDFVEQVRQIITEEAIDPKYIHLEITESTTLHDIQYSIGLVDELKSIGVSVSLDDFGTGYSALSYLKDFPIDILKIDRSFIRNLKADSQDRAIVKAIIMMSQGLSLTTIAEGVETKEQRQLLKHYGCHVAQGFYYSQPLPSHEFEAYIKQSANPA